MEVRLIAVTSYTDGLGGAEGLIEWAGRICYRSRAADREARIKFIQGRLQAGHESIIEHASASFEISGISRACSHQLVRHRLASFSQESQRYVDMSKPEWVVPPTVSQAGPAVLAVWQGALRQVQSAYQALREKGVPKEDARFLLPNATATRMIMTANFREWLHIIRLRLSRQAQWEIREVAALVLLQLHNYYPAVFGEECIRFREEMPELHAKLVGDLGFAE